MEEDFSEAIRWVSSAADLRHPVALANPANIYAEGKGVPLDDRRYRLFEGSIRNTAERSGAQLHSLSQERSLSHSGVGSK